MPSGLSGGRLVADAGGSNIRFAIADRTGGLTEIQSYRVTDFPTFAAALRAYGAAAETRRNVMACAIAAAGPVDDGRVKITNNDWLIDRAEVSAGLGNIPVAVLNDLEAAAMALPHLAANDVAAIGGPAVARDERRTMLALNVGTGFGAASAMFRDGRWFAGPSEAGHATLNALAENDATVESVLSGPGVVALYRRHAAAGGGKAATPDEAGQVFAAAGRDPVATRVVEEVTAILGRVAGNLTLATAAWGGVYFCGSVAAAWAPLADPARFRAAFAGNGPMRARLEQVPTAVIRRDNINLFGLAMLPL